METHDLAVDCAESKELASSRSADVTRLAVAFQDWVVDVKRDASPPAPRPPRSKK